MKERKGENEERTDR